MIIDFHSHFVPQNYPALPDGVTEPAWPRMEPADGGAQMYVGDRAFRVFEDFYWDVEKRVADMDEKGVDLQVISPLPELVSYWLDPKAAVALTNALNADCAAMVVQAPDRLKGLCAVALQDVDAAVIQLETIRKITGIIGIFVGSHVNGVSIASRQFDPVFAACERLGLLVFVHGIKPNGLERMEGPALMAAVLGIPHENTQAIGSFIMNDVLGRYPDLKLVFSHGGGGIGMVIDRMNLVWEKFPVMQQAQPQSPREYAKRFWYDTAVFGPEVVAYLVDRFGAGQIIAGTDGPTEIGERDISGFLSRAGLEPADKERVIAGNALQLIEECSIKN